MIHFNNFHEFHRNTLYEVSEMKEGFLEKVLHLSKIFEDIFSVLVFRKELSFEKLLVLKLLKVYIRRETRICEMYVYNTLGEPINHRFVNLFINWLYFV